MIRTRCHQHLRSVLKIRENVDVDNVHTDRYADTRIWSDGVSIRMSGGRNVHSMNFGLFYGTFYVEAGSFSGPKLEGKNTAA